MKARLLNHRDSLISVALLLLILLVAASFIVSPLVSQYEQYQLELTKDARLLQQLGAVAESKQELQQAFQMFETQELSSWLYDLEEPAAVALDVQRRVSAEVAKNNGQLRTISPMPAKRKDDYLLVGVQVNFTADYESVLQILKELETDKPLLAIDTLRFAPIAYRARAGELERQQLNVQMSVTTFVRAEFTQGGEL
ncbi:type II secretion system protein GspM [Denitrificimonas caeni]|uniref:type II secretion system protein GspM n=1 Tax=Denitrificimonas caeni TaxID=521720 RepID=UPI00196447AB|nr:type II secretion system protein GspM [Denitrificimonas caeni]